MANGKKPSIYYDRGTIGSSDDLDEYGVWVKSEPQDLSSAGIESQEFPDFPESDLPDFDAGADAGELELPDIDFDDPVPKEETIDFGEPSEGLDKSAGADDTGSFEFGELPEPDFSDFTESLDLIQSGEETGAEEKAEDPGFVEALPVDAGDETGAEPAAEALQAPALPVGGENSPEGTNPSTQELSTRLLMKIADELAAIRVELSTFKNELAALKTKSAPAEAGETQNHGFFDEEDDEKIALTGDELDNILNTADFTEEAGTDAAEEPGDAAETGGLSLDDIAGDLDLDLSLEEKEPDEPGSAAGIDQSAGSGEAPAHQAPLPEEPIEFDIALNEGEDDLSLEIPLDEAVPEDLSGWEDKDSEDLRRIGEEGVQPMTAAPEAEDAGFLEDDPLAAAQFDEDSLDFSNAVIDEPDLSGEIQENPLQEPSLENISLEDISLDDISIDLELDEAISLDEGEEDIGETAEIGEDETGGIEEIGIPEKEIEFAIPDESFGTGEEESEESSAGLSDLALIPEGFVVEAENSRVPAAGEGEEVFSEAAEPETTGSDDAVLEAETIEETLSPVPEEGEAIPSHLKQELKTVLSYMDQLLESLPDEKIEEFAKSEYFDTYKKLFQELGLV
ncbi:MAG: hypothetical protein LBQ67_07490 [Treponema sp.]|jgi:hypothetical protein|nr:hypothetical protein [Treponema sp.]